MAKENQTKYHLHLKGTVGYWDFSADMVDYVLKKNKDTEVNVLIDSLGGYVPDALSISTYFKLHGNVNVHYIGMNASAATIASMGAKTVSMDSDALYLVHRCSYYDETYGKMNAEDIERKIKDLQQLKQNAQAIDLAVATMYARRCKKKGEDLIELMKQERWLTAKEAKEWGFVDEITDSDQDKKERPDRSTLAAMAKAGLPEPPKDTTLFSQVKEWIRTSIKEIKAESDQNPDDHNNTPNISSMTDLTEINGILGVSEIDSKDGMASISEYSLKKINTEIAGLRAQVNDLKKKPADSGIAVVETARMQQPSHDDFDSVAAEARKMFNRINR